MTVPRSLSATEARRAGELLSRRRFLRSAGIATAALGLGACGVQPEQRATGGSLVQPPTAAPAPVELGPVGGELNVSSWPLYVDVDERDENVRPTVEQFRKETGVVVNYREDINSNDEYFGKVRNQLAAGEDIGRDVIVLTDWMAGRLINLGWVTPLDPSRVPNKDNLLPQLQRAAFDPGRRYSVTWQSGMTGIGYNREVVGRELHSVNDLFAPDLEGRVTLLSELRQTIPLVLLSMGVDPANHEFSQYEAAIDKLQRAVDSGQVRGFTGNEYINDLAAGNIAAAVAYSGDILQLQLDNPDLRFLIPDEGAVLWSDEMLIPRNAKHPANAHAWMDYYLQPETAARLAAWVNYISPVQGAQAAMERIDPKLAANPLIFPDAATLSRTHQLKVLDEEEDRRYQALFQGVTGA